MRVLVLVVLAGAAACTPFYRVDQVEGLRVASGEERSRLEVRARELLSEGRAQAAADAWQEALALDPNPSAESFLALAQAQAAAGDRPGARASARLGLEAAGAGAPETARALKALLVHQYAADGLVEPALDFLPDARLESALEVPELARTLGPLLEVDGLARAGRLEAVERYESWLSSFGVPTHRLLVAWSVNVRGLAAGPAAQVLVDAERALAERRTDDAAQLLALAFHFQAPADQDRSARFEALCARLGDGAVTAEARAAAVRAREALAANRLGDALQGARQAVALAPCWPEARHDLALLLARIDQYAAALPHLRFFTHRSMDAARVARAQALALEWARRADPAQAARLAAEARDEASVRADQRRRARAWRDGGFSVMSVGAVLGAGAVACAVVGLRTNEQIQSGAFATGRDILLAAELGQTANTLGTVLAATGGALVAIGLPIVLFNLDPAAPQVSAIAGPGFAGFAVSGVLP